MTTNRVPLDVLDLTPISEGSTARDALQNTIDLARRTEDWGFHRYWVAEHHFVAAASSAPDVLIGLIAAATRRIRVGSAAVQIGHRTAVSVVEAFGVIDALHPGRIDLGLGRSGQRRTETDRRPPATARETTVRHGIPFPASQPSTAVLTSERFAAATSVLQGSSQVPDFDDQLDEVTALLSGRFRAGNGVRLSATPGEGADVELWLFGSSAGQSAHSAGSRGLPFVANYHVSPGTTLEAIEAYRSAFTPGVLARPYVVVSADVLAAESDSHAEYLAKPFPHWVHSIRSGRGAVPYPDPRRVGPLPPDQQALVADRIATRIVGSAENVADRLERLQRATGAAELLVTTIAHDHQDRVRSYELLARAWAS